MRGVIHHADYELEYFIFGKGPKTMLAFHGFNNSAHDFESLGEVAGNLYTIISVNIFFHGNSTVEERMIQKGFSIEDLSVLFTDLYNVKPTEKYTLIGFSLGGRIVLKLLELFPEKIEEIILLAPDGFYTSPFYLFLTRTKAGRLVLKQTIKNPGTFNNIAGILRKTGIISEKRYQFARNNFDNSDRREKVYQVWLTLRNVLSKKGTIKELLVKYDIKMHLFFGKYDKIIPPSIGLNFSKGSEKHVFFNELEEGHRLMRKDIFEKVLKNIETSNKKL